MADDEDELKGRKIRGIIIGFGDFEVDPEQAGGVEVDFATEFDEMFEHGVEMAKALKVDLVQNGPDDIPPMCVGIFGQGNFHLPVAEMCDGAGLRPPEAISVCLQVVTQMFGPPIAVCVLLETLMLELEQATMPALYPGELAERWNAGEREGLSEALVVIQATSTRFHSKVLPYHYGDGSVVWTERLAHDTEIEGWPDTEPTGSVEAAVVSAFRQEKGGGDGADGT
jgi:hypothetical protein